MDKNRSTAIAPIFEFVIVFLQSILLHYRVFAIEFFCNQVFFALEFLQLSFLQSSFCNRVFYNPVFAVDLASSSSTTFYSVLPHPCSIQVPTCAYTWKTK